MNSVVMRKIDVGADYQPLSEKREVLTVDLSAPPTNAGPVYFKGDDGSDVPWVPGEFHTLHRVDLSAIQVKGAVGDCVTVVGIGGAW